ncbi:MAG: PEP-CTERM sorting domain-containing protein [Phycisphaerales bacterium]
MKKYVSFAMLIAFLAGMAPMNVHAVLTNGNWDASYDPASTTPPSGQSKWTVANAATPNILSWDASTGLGKFWQNGGSAMSIKKRFVSVDAGTIDVKPSQEWAFEIKMKINSWTAANDNVPVLMGFRDEGGGDGKGVMFSLQGNATSVTGPNGGSNSGRIVLTSSTGPAAFKAMTATNSTYIGDGLFHTYTLTKGLDAGVMTVKLAVDGVNILSAAYSNFNAATANTNGVGLYGSSGTSYNSDIIIDYMAFGETIPEPTTLALLGLGCMIFVKRKN